jgi:hypothetical protein
MSDNDTLEKYLPGPRCELCGAGNIRPVDVVTGNLVFNCSNLGVCHFTAFAPLPQLSKTWIYVDPLTVSRMAKARTRGDASSPHFRLYEALRRASARNLVALPGSTMFETAAEYAEMWDLIVEMSRELSSPSLRDDLEVKEAQLARALDRWLRDEQPLLEVKPPWQDAFATDPDVWQTAFQTLINVKMPDGFVQSVKRAKDEAIPVIAAAYEAYCADDFSFEQVVRMEKTSFGKEAILTGRNVRATRAAFLRGEPIDPTSVPFSTTLDRFTIMIAHRLKCGSDAAYARAIDFLVSPHAAEIPFSDISAHLQAGLAMLCRGDNPRQPQPGDQYEIDHTATFLPYVDVFISHGEVAEIAVEHSSRIGEKYATKVQQLDEPQIPAFIDWLESLAEGNEIAALSTRVNEAILRGGFDQYFTSAVHDQPLESGQNRNSSKKK